MSTYGKAGSRRPSALAHNIVHSPEYIARMSSGHHSRKIFHLLPPHHNYDDFELQSLEEFSRYLYKQGVEAAFDQAVLLRFLYSAGFNLEDATRRLSIYQQWMSSPSLQQMTPKIERILKSGVAYSHGTDRLCRPVIYLNLPLADFGKNTMEEYFCATKLLLDSVMEGYFVPGRVENWVIVIDTGGKLFLPLHMIQSVAKKLAVVYCERLEKMYILNVNALLRVSYNIFKQFIDKRTQGKIQLLDASELTGLQRCIPPEQLEKKYGGLRPNLSVYRLPDQVEQDCVSHNVMESTAVQSCEQSLYQSFADTDSKSLTDQLTSKQTNCSCFQGSSCSLF